MKCLHEIIVFMVKNEKVGYKVGYKKVLQIFPEDFFMYPRVRLFPDLGRLTARDGLNISTKI